MQARFPGGFGPFAVLLLVLNLDITVAQRLASGSGPDTAGRFRVESNLVLVPVVVRDALGRPVEGLTRNDFRVWDGGQEQTITQFEEERAGTAPSPSESKSPTLTAAPPERFIALFFDDLNATTDQIIRTRDAAEARLPAMLTPRTRVAVVTPHAVLADFTNDPAKLHQALSSLRVTRNSTTAGRLCPDISDYQAEGIVSSSDIHTDAWQQAIAEAKHCDVSSILGSGNGSVNLVMIRNAAQAIVGATRDRARTALSGLQQLAKFMAVLPGRRDLIILSPGFFSTGTEFEVDRIIESAARSGVVIDALDPTGLATTIRESNAARSTTEIYEPQALQSMHTLDAQRTLVIADVLAALTQGTGGTFLWHNNDLSAGLEQLTGAPSHYLLAFAPPDLKRDNKFHLLRVALATPHRDYSVAARRGYVATIEPPATEPAPAVTASGIPASAGIPAVQPDATTTTAPRSPADIEKQQVADALKASADIPALHMGTEVSQTAAANGAFDVSVLVHLDVAPLHFQIEDGAIHDSLLFAVAIYDRDNKLVSLKERRADLNVGSEILPRLLENGVETTADFTLQPGEYRIRAVVREAGEQRLGAVSNQLHVPEEQEP